MRILTPKEVANKFVAIGISKREQEATQIILLSVLAGMFIAYGGFASTVIAQVAEKSGFARLLSASVFPVGLMMIIFTGAELFTGNNLLVIPFFEKKISFKTMLNNWLVVYLGNFIGSLLIVFLILGSGLLSSSKEILGLTQFVAKTKMDLSLLNILTRAILCNIIVVLAVWMATSSQNVIGKIFACWFPIMLFVVSGFEHSIANMYFIPMGILSEGLDGLTNQNLLGFFRNLITVTVGNVIGGVFVSFIGWFVYLRRKT